MFISIHYIDGLGIPSLCKPRLEPARELATKWAFVILFYFSCVLAKKMITKCLSVLLKHVSVVVLKCTL